MNAFVEPPLRQASRLAAQIEAAAARIAPNWPLDRLIAVNPCWGWIDRPMPEAAAWLGVLAGARLTLPRPWFAAQQAAGRFARPHLEAAMRDAGDLRSLDAVLAETAADSPPPARLPLVADLCEGGAPPRPGQGWAEAVTHQISQHCAAFFDRHQAGWGLDPATGLYGSWRAALAADRGLRWRHPRRWLRDRLAALPEPRACIAAALDALGVADDGREAYLAALLLSIGGWAAWCAWLRWQARLKNEEDAQIVELLAIRLAWEWLLHDDAPAGTVPAGWAAGWGRAGAAARALQQAQRTDWLLQSALERAWQDDLAARLVRPAPAAPPAAAPQVQAVFCIDVRSEVFRRALESADPAVQTRGFAGFFGLPIDYSPLGSALVRPQTPGLLEPAQGVDEVPAPGADGAALGQVLGARRRQALRWRQRWEAFRTAPASAFSFVESVGLLYGAKLLADSLPSRRSPARWEDAGLPRAAAAGLRPRLRGLDADPAAAAGMAAGILRAMGLVEGFAPWVLLVGHGSRSANNPQAASLDCGACGGQTGEVNARVLADLLNAPAVRAQLRTRGIEIPPVTHFLPALHHTTTDEVTLFDTDAVPPGRQAELAGLQGRLEAAGRLARAERAPGLGLAALQGRPQALQQALQRRANDWAELRPEWGLADNAAFIVAPRRRTRGLDLGGRCFLHDYDWRADEDGAVLAGIMTAPMIVTHWINLQYHASTVDHRRWGSGDKTLHNVVGGRIGVFEGNGGDLRIGLARQSLHDGQRLRHTPLRLAVCIEAPRRAIERVVAGHETVRRLVAHGWLHLLRIDPETPRVERWQAQGWVPAGPGGPVGLPTEAADAAA